MKENAFSSKFRKELKTFLDMQGLSSHINLIVDAPRSLKKPYDTYAIISRRFFSFEFKVCNGASTTHDRVTKHQMENALEVAEAGGNAFIVMYVGRLKTAYMCYIQSVHFNMWDMVFKGENRVKVEEFDERFCEIGLKFKLERNKVEGKTMYDFRGFTCHFLT